MLQAGVVPKAGARSTHYPEFEYILLFDKVFDLFFFFVNN